MNLERAAMRGKLAGLEQEETRLIMRMESGAKAVRQGLNTTLVEVWDLEIPQLDEQWDILKCSWGELIKVRADIARLKRELA
jgi:hypothetical protein